MDGLLQKCLLATGPGHRLCAVFAIATCFLLLFLYALVFNLKMCSNLKNIGVSCGYSSRRLTSYLMDCMTRLTLFGAFCTSIVSLDCQFFVVRGLFPLLWQDFYVDLLVVVVWNFMSQYAF